MSNTQNKLFEIGSVFECYTDKKHYLVKDRISRFGENSTYYLIQSITDVEPLVIPIKQFNSVVATVDGADT